jgi:DNA-binding NarL/FixJ family response regulator
VSAAASPVRLVVVDDHTLFRQGMIEMLSSAAEFEVVADGGSGPEAVRLARAHQPDVLLLDVEMPGPGAKATIGEVRAVAPRTRIAILSMYGEAGLVRELLEAGAAAYLVKTIVRDQLIAAVRSIARSGGDVLMSVPRTTLEGFDPSRKSALLSPRELDVLRLIALARSNAQVASELFITEGTVKRHLTNIYAKLGAVSRVDAIRKARAARIISDA